jgi:hypothetical protein
MISVTPKKRTTLGNLNPGTFFIVENNPDVVYKKLRLEGAMGYYECAYLDTATGDIGTINFTSSVLVDKIFPLKQTIDYKANWT